MLKIIHLNSGFMLTSMLGFLITVLYIPKYSMTWAITFAVVFVLMFIASVISMTYAPIRDPYEEHMLAVHEQVARNPPGHYRHKKTSE